MASISSYVKYYYYDEYLLGAELREMPLKVTRENNFSGWLSGLREGKHGARVVLVCSRPSDLDAQGDKVVSTLII